MAEENCCLCKFEHEGLCRRYAPRASERWLAYHNSELLRSIAWSLHTLGEIEKPGKYDDLNREATEVGSTTWPRVEDDDWCGEFERDLMKPKVKS